MIRYDTYIYDGKRREFRKAKERKDKLREEGWRVKIRKGKDGEFVIWKKHIEIIDVWNHATRFGCRKHPKKIPGRSTS